MTDSAPLQPHQASGTGRRLAMFRAPLSGPNQSGGIDTIVNRSRHMGRNNPWVKASVDKYVANAIGTGIQAKCINGTAEQKKARHKKWRRWCKVADADGQLTFEALQALAVAEYREAGECFARLRPRRPSDGLPVPLQVQLIESEQCPRHYYSTAPNGNAIKEGIEFGPIGNRVAYWFYRAHPGDQNPGTVNASELVRIPADQIIHLFRPLRAGQLRGVPDLAGVAAHAYNLDRINDSTIERVKVGNLFAGFLKRTKGGSDTVLGETQVDTDTDDTPIAGLEPGTMVELPDGVEPVFSDPPNAGSDYPQFMRFNLLAFAARVGVPYEVLTGDLANVSDRALKLILLEFHRLIEMDLWLYMIPQFCQRIRNAWWDAAVLAGALAAPGYAERSEVDELIAGFGRAPNMLSSGAREFEADGPTVFRFLRRRSHVASWVDQHCVWQRALARQRLRPWTRA